MVPKGFVLILTVVKGGLRLTCLARCKGSRGPTGVDRSKKVFVANSDARSHHANVSVFCDAPTNSLQLQFPEHHCCECQPVGAITISNHWGRRLARVLLHLFLVNALREPLRITVKCGARWKRISPKHVLRRQFLDELTVNMPPLPLYCPTDSCPFSFAMYLFIKETGQAGNNFSTAAAP